MAIDMDLGFNSLVMAVGTLETGKKIPLQDLEFFTTKIKENI